VLSQARDIWANLVLAKRLGELRERLADRLLAGGALTLEEVERAEGEIWDQIRRDYYSADVRIASGADASSDEEDFDRRTQRLADQATLATHRRLLDIPLVGDPYFVDADLPEHS
jgi:hypothetical protein